MGACAVQKRIITIVVIVLVVRNAFEKDEGEVSKGDRTEEKHMEGREESRRPSNSCSIFALPLASFQFASSAHDCNSFAMVCVCCNSISRSLQFLGAPSIWWGKCG